MNPVFEQFYHYASVEHVTTCTSGFFFSLSVHSAEYIHFVDVDFNLSCSYIRTSKSINGIL